MIYALKLLFVVMLVCIFAAIAFRRSFSDVLTPAQYRHAWRLVILGSIASFLCKFPPLFLLVYAAIALYGNATIGNRTVSAITVYVLLATVAPSISFGLGGVGGINYFLRIDHYRIVALVLLLGPALRLASTKRGPGYGSFAALDFCLIAFSVFRIALNVPFSTTTSLVRMAVEAFLDILLPYYVATRSIRTLADLRFVAAHLALGLIFAASVAVVEFATQHNYYPGLQSIYGISWQLTFELMRGGLIRVQAMTEQPILLAVAMVFGIGLWVWLKGAQWRRPTFMLAFAAFMVALVGTWSRGPWLACAVLLLMLLALHKLTPGAVRILLLLSIGAGILVKAAGADAVVASAVVALFGGSSDDASTIDYRRQLLDTSLALIQQSPWFGVPNYAAQMQDLKQGQGIIDIVNSYLAVMLSVGVVGLALYLAPYVIVIHRMLGAIRRDDSGRVSQGSRFAVSLVAMNIACLFAIFTTSTFGILPLLLLLLVALPAAWLAMPVQERDSMPQPSIDSGLRRGLPARYGPIRSKTA